MSGAESMSEAGLAELDYKCWVGARNPAVMETRIGSQPGGMEHKLLWSGVGLSLGLGLGLGLAVLAKAAFIPCLTPPQSLEMMEIELGKQVMDAQHSAVTFDQFPYYLNEQTKALLVNAAYVHLKAAQFSKFTRNLAPASKTILLSGPLGTESYQKMLARALAHHFDAKLLLLDCSYFSSKRMKSQDKESRSCFESIPNRVVGLCGPLTTRILAVKEVLQTGGLKENKGKVLPASMRKVADELVQKGVSSAMLNEDLFVEALFRVINTTAQTSAVVLYLRDVERTLFRNPKIYMLFLRKLKKLSGPVLVVGSRIVGGGVKEEGVEEKLSVLFPYNINIKPPEDNTCLVSWKSQLEEDMKAIQAEDNRNHISEVLSANDVECDDLLDVCFGDTDLIGQHIEEIVVSAISDHLKHTEEPAYRAGKLLISSKSLAYGLSLFQAGQLDKKSLKPQLELKNGGDNKQEAGGTSSSAKTEVLTPEVAADATKASETCTPEVPKKVETTEAAKSSVGPSSAKPTDVAPDNEFEKRIRPEVIPAGQIGVNFKDIGALDNVKETLQELVMLPLRRPELFSRGGLVKRCKGILLFGPPGTGKTMLAKAVATEAGASFINVSMSAITSKWFGEDEKNVRALFTLAAKVAPTVIFVDEVDSMLGQRSRVGEHEAMRKIKNEFMAHWDGLLSKGGDRVLVLAATNRPFDLDEAIIRRFERRILVGLPDTENREKILRAILSKEDLAEDFDFKELAVMTEGYTGSDLKNMCVAAAYIPVREFLKQEREQEAQRKVAEMAPAEPAKADDASTTTCTDSEPQDANAEPPSTTATEVSEKNKAEPKGSADVEASADVNAPSLSPISLRPLNLKDFRQAKTQVSASFASEGAGMQELQEWNELYGEGGSRKKQQLSYFM